MRLFRFVLLALVLGGCAGMQRSCSSCTAGALGADWVVVKTTMDGKPFRCWKLEGVSVSNEAQSDGVYWQSGNGHLVHIAGTYDRVQVEKGGWKSAFTEVGLTEEQCKALGGAQ